MPRSGGIDEIANLATHVRTNCQGELQKIWRQYSGAVETFPKGLYEINIEDPNDAPMLKKMPWDTK
jgi:hypothetical protein